jgi:hypothetical protein
VRTAGGLERVPPTCQVVPDLHEQAYADNTSGTFADVNLEARRPDRPVPLMAGTAAVGAVVHLLATAIEEGRDLSSMSGILADSSYRLLPA